MVEDEDEEHSLVVAATLETFLEVVMVVGAFLGRAGSVKLVMIVNDEKFTIEVDVIVFNVEERKEEKTKRIWGRD